MANNSINQTSSRICAQFNVTSYLDCLIDSSFVFVVCHLTYRQGFCSLFFHFIFIHHLADTFIQSEAVNNQRLQRHCLQSSIQRNLSVNRNRVAIGLHLNTLMCWNALKWPQGHVQHCTFWRMYMERGRSEVAGCGGVVGLSCPHGYRSRQKKCVGQLNQEPLAFGKDMLGCCVSARLPPSPLPPHPIGLLP